MADIDEFEYLKDVLSKDELLSWVKKNDPKRLKEVEGIKKLSEKEVWDLNKNEQVKIIESYGEKVPKYEKDRVELILKLQ